MIGVHAFQRKKARDIAKKAGQVRISALCFSLPDERKKAILSTFDRWMLLTDSRRFPGLRSIRS